MMMIMERLADATILSPSPSPSSSCVYLVIVLVAVLIAGSILLAFMFPRSASITVVAMNSTRDWVPLSNSSAIEIMMEVRTLSCISCLI